MATTTQTSKPQSKTTSPPRKIRPGFISHTELASNNPTATKAWCEKVLGWKFGDSMPSPNGPYHVWSFGENAGGGIRNTNPGEPGGTIPYAEVPDIKAAFAAAKKAGASEMLAPMEIPGGGWMAVVQAPGGVPIGFWSN
jgi:predicted enzyme related to lactoylglutathione lyase